uniref:tyrosine-type recombinase/integrase n=1 Tax=Alteromonas genovensis TaxID=471225 RepID=UPI002FE1448B
LVNAGKKVFSITVEEMVQIYLDHRQRHVELGLLSAGRHYIISCHLKHLTRLLGAGTRVNDLDRRSLQDYAFIRRSEKAGIKNATINNEQATINACFRYCYDEGLVHIQKLKFDVLPVEDSVDRRARATFTPEQFQKLTGVMQQYVLERNISAEVGLLRQMIRLFIIVSAETMMRFGELRQLQWRSVSDSFTRTDSNGVQHSLVKITVLADTSKVRKTRNVIAKAGSLFDEIRSVTEHFSGDDYVFSVEAGRMLTQRQMYSCWRELMLLMGLPDYKEDNLSYYSLRHYGITERVRAGAKYQDIARVAGTSITHIENTYLHADDEIDVAAVIGVK